LRAGRYFLKLGAKFDRNAGFSHPDSVIIELLSKFYGDSLEACGRMAAGSGEKRL
jgi:hypothetical protein